MTAKAEKFYRVEFKVTGHGEFPYDMLRYDQCVPKEGINSIPRPFPSSRDGTSPKIREVTLVRYTPNRNSGPTEARWLSFGWAVVRDSVRFL